MQHRGFTLIQLLLAVLGLAIVLVILVPVFPGRGSRYHYRRVACQSNLKQVSLAFRQYIQDAEELFPLTNSPRYNRADPKSFTLYGGLLGTHWVHALQPYLKTMDNFQCPTDSEGVNGEPNAFGTDYYYNSIVAGENETCFNNSAATVLLTEGADTFDASRAVASGPQIVGIHPPYARHLDGSNYAFLDGHVKWLQATRAPGQQPADSGGFTFKP